MVALHEHPVLMTAPWYGVEGRTALHRYLEDDFVTAFLEDLHHDRLAARRSWEQQDVIGKHRDVVTLRQPMHRAFYVSSCEIGCEVLGDRLPALDPAKVASAGLVVRRVPPGGRTFAWTVADGVPRGWQALSSNGADPDLRRRVPRLRFDTGPDRDPPFSGEEIHPMHARCITDAAGVRRTVLYGYLPLAGTAPLAVPRTADQARDRADDVLGELRWPFGRRDLHPWEEADGQLVLGGRPTLPFLEVLRVIVGRYRVGMEPTDSANADLEAVLAGLPYPHVHVASAGRFEIPSFLDYLRDQIAHRESEFQTYLFAEREASDFPNGRAMGAFGLPGDDRVGSHPDLVLTEGQAETLRAMLVSRYGTTLERNDHRVMLPRYGQDDDDVYVARPFARVRQGGCEELVWGPESARFRVAGPFDPDLSPSVSIPMPRLSDLRRGLAKAEFLLPNSLARKVMKLKPGAGLVPDIEKPEPDTFGVKWIVSFSIPIVTLCAMILLMIVVSILNIVFNWIPYVITRMPIFVRRSSG